MKFCQSHWDDLRAAIDAVGLGAWVPDDGERAMRNQVELMAGAEPTVDNFDPLMSAHWAIASNMISACRENGDNALAMVLLGGPVCPLCLGNQMISGQGPYATTRDLLDILAAGTVRGGYDWWIATAARDQRSAWKRFGSVPTLPDHQT